MPRKRSLLSSNAFNLFLLACAFLAGFTIAKSYNFPIVSIGESIDVGDLFSGVTTCVSAWYVAKIIGQETESVKQIKEILLQRFAQLLDEINSCADVIRLVNIGNSSELNSSLKRIRTIANSIKEMSNSVTSNADIAALHGKLASQLDEVWELISETPDYTQEDLNKEAETQNKFALHFARTIAQKKGLIEVKFNAAKTTIAELQMEIIRASDFS